MRMCGPSGNQHARNLLDVISHIQKHEGAPCSETFLAAPRRLT